MTQATPLHGPRKRVLIVYTEIMEYWVPIFAKLGKTIDLPLTKCNPSRRTDQDDAVFREVAMAVFK
ncbi:hypothetical protein [Antarctobacter heliothermus]|uniref:Uncharacterized protein n=1 Tax=Antarctobacter heliothermus TaxID=74033 RepID=A0A239D9W7_9RHOB|nr:hypothetical protein [Antarctobacter heliothermus]SNS28858.1 hypothetical protein SAMN04488078_10109 [Antarctobacter heliothermus]